VVWKLHQPRKSLVLIQRSAEASIDTTHQAAEPRERWEVAMPGLDRDATAQRLADQILVSPVLSSDLAARLLGVG
jgi:hypothetical protein